MLFSSAVDRSARTSLRAGAAILLILVAAAMTYAISASSADAAPISACTSTKGSIVAVDFAHWGGPVVRGCDTSKPQNGAALLTDEGFTLAGDERDGPAVMCRIGNQAFHNGTQYPTPAEDPCVNTPPTSAYWSYWLAPAGKNSWTYSPNGAYSDKPKPGEVELWIFGATNASGTEGRPTCKPAVLRAAGSTGSCSPGSGTTNPTPSPSDPSTSTGSSPTRSSGPGRPPTSTATKPRTTTSPRSGHVTPHPTATSGSTHAARPTIAPSASRALARVEARASRQARAQSRAAASSSTAAGAAPPTSTGPPPTAGQIVDAEPASQQTASHGSPDALIIGLLIAAALAAAGGIAIWRRRAAAGS